MPMQLLRNTALRQTHSGSVASFTRSNGNILTVVADTNLSTVTTGGDQSNNLKIYIYETVVSTRATTLRHTITSFPVSAAQNVAEPLLDVSRVMVAQFPNGDDLAIAVGRTDRNSFYYTKFTYATPATSAFETVNMPSVPNDTFQKWSMVVSDTGSVYWAAWIYNASTDQLKLNLHLRRSADNTWQTIQNFVGATYSPITSVANYWHEPSNIKILALNVVANVANCVVFFAGGGSSSSGARRYQEPRIMTFKMNETTGAVSSITSRGAYGGMAPMSNQRHAMDLFRTGRHGYIWFLQGMTYPSQTTATEQKQYHAKSATYDGTNYVQDVDSTIWTEGTNQAFSLTDNINFSAATFSCDTADVPYNKCAFAWIYPRVTNSNPSGSFQASGYGYYWGDLYGTHTLKPAPLLDNGGLSSGKIKRNAYPGISNWRPTSMAKSKMPFVLKTDDGKMWLDWVEPESQWNVTTKAHGSVGSSEVAFTPSEGSNYQTGAPPTTVTFDNNKPTCPTPWRMEFQASQDSGFASGIKTSVWPNAAGKFPSGTDSSAGVTVGADWTTDVAQKLISGTWYIRCRMIDYVGNVGPWSPSPHQITIGHPPTAIPKSPINSISIPEVGGDQYEFSWDFADTFAGDTQSAYQVKVYRASDDVVVVDTGKVISSDTTVALTIDTSTSTFYELYWNVALWDADDANGPASEFQYFNIIQPPTVTLDDPTDEEVVATNIPAVSFTPTSPNGYTFNKYTITVTQNGVALYSTEVTGSWASGSPINDVIPPGYITIGTGYQIYVTVTDSSGFAATSATNDFTVSWVAPAATTIIVDTSVYASAGNVKVIWDNTEKDIDWVGYNIYRSYDAGVTYDLVYAEDANSANYEYSDYLALSGVDVWYAVVQVVNTSGFIREGVYNWVMATPVADGYWIVRTGHNLAAYRIFSVTDDTYTDEQEEAEFAVIGRGRVVNKGDRLGLKGSMTAKLRDNSTYTAREMKQQLEELQHENVALLLRTPFGDIYNVSLSSMSVSRIAGVGHAEFCDVTIPYSEVAE